MKISLVIPCTPAHFENLAPKLDAIVSGTRIPEEVVISLSNAHLVPSIVLEKIEKEFSPKVGKFTLLKHDKIMTHGPNRQAGSESASGDLLIYQDADDFSHPQRVEIIEYFFENHEIMHLNHAWVTPNVDFENFEKTNISYINSEEIYKHYFPNNNFSDSLGPGCYGGPKSWRLSYGPGFINTTAGHTSVLKEVLDRVRWKDRGELIYPAEDYEFCMEVVYEFKKSMILDAPLIYYTNG